ncbi:cytochrome P450 2B5-like [Mizuhopecten yessoensis]|uniref:Cytochrome P450 2J6 n=1 Tax=Mizuhopecten yessoensis TaxID=6573 RepID=A0A210QE95_MIZYE|nr:cytochrome P450 2B5-like [Mizuhopecten yessoensis]OWF47049.1 Cytochrome P450 2J6 [Mizuhopecten yessoensis]
MDFNWTIGLENLTVTIVIFLLILLVIRSLQSPSNIPPGPTGYPVLGCIPLMRKGNVLEIFQNLRTQYGDVFSIKLGSNFTVVINGVDALNEAFVKNADRFSDRPDNFAVPSILRGKGIGASSGEHWKLTRTFSLLTLRGFGFGRKILESKVKEEVTAFLDVIEKQKGQPYDVKELILISVSNIICSIAFGNRYEYTDAKFKRLTALLNENFRLNTVAGAIRQLPWLRFLPGDVFSIKKFHRNGAQVKEFANGQIADHRETFDENNPRDFIDVFLQQQSKAGRDHPIFEDANLAAIIKDLFSAGTETTSAMIRWAILYLIHNRPVQDKLRHEVATVVGTSRLPSLDDKASMPYYEAFIMEVLRMGNIAPLSVGHGARTDIHFRGMMIPRGSIIIPNLNSVMTDPDLFEDPQKFNPDRFLGKDGRVIDRKKMAIAFSLGRRMCLGQSLAKIELFLFITALIQRFEFLPENPDRLPPLEGVVGLSRTPKPYKFRAVTLN